MAARVTRSARGLRRFASRHGDRSRSSRSICLTNQGKNHEWNQNHRQYRSTGAVATPNLGDPLNDPASILVKRSVYFDFDKYSVKNEYKAMVEAHGKYLAGHPERKVIIQGHTDERGGSEYNLALGQKRAEAVRRALSLAGAKEAAWAENRRADIEY